MLLLIFSFIPLITSLFMYYNSIFMSMELTMISLYSINIPMSILLDWTSMMFLFTVMFISSMILLFSMEYISPKEHKQFSLMLLSFVFSMMVLIMSDNIIFILLGWDGLGLTSFILVVYYQNYSSSASGMITIFSNRMGDILILLSIALLTSNCNWNFFMNQNFSYTTLTFLMLAACSKSAQFPFSAWLPAAMAAPTPISALVHSSTLVTAGVYLLIRILNYPHPTSMLLLMIISSMTVIYASMSANWEMDMKKIIALSTLSQIAMMMYAISLGSIILAFMHLIIHALFKSLMFLCGGIIIHSSSYQDMRHMGSMMNYSPLTSTIMGISSLSLMGVPFMSGFFSKDPIIESILYSKIYSIMSFIMIFSIGLTSMYSIRMTYFTFKFSLKSKPDMMINFNNFMNNPIMIMAPFSIIMGTLMFWISTPEQILIIPTPMKLMILIILTSGLLMGYSLSYFAKKYKSMGQASNSLWFNHFLLTIPFILTSVLMQMFSKNDKNWQESYGPNYCYKLFMMSSSQPDLINTQLLFIIMMMFMFPLLMLMI